MPLTCREYLLRGAEDPQKLRGLFCCATGVRVIAVSCGGQHDNIEQIATALFEMRQAFANAHQAGAVRL
jgi:hypothetical protein